MSDRYAFAKTQEVSSVDINVKIVKVMAQMENINEVRGEYPVLLLDDIMSELDKSRRLYLAEKIKDKQVLITATDTDIIKSTDTTKLFYVENGTIREE